MKFITFFSIIIFLISPLAGAHEFWLEAHPYYQKPNKSIEISVNVGENMKGEPIPNIPAWFLAFDAQTEKGLQDVTGELGADPAGVFYHKTEGVYAIGYLSSQTPTTFNAEKFNTYLKKQGLEKIMERRATLNETDKEGREIYSRNVKTLVKIGTRNDVSFYQHDFGHPLNINALKNPYTLNINDELPIQITFNQQPAVNLLVRAKLKDHPEINIELRTDINGKASFPITQKGVWLIHAVEMIASDLDDIEWESFWGSLTFEIR